MKATSKTVTWAAACCTVVAGFEGCWTVARVDNVGTGRPLTWCYGETIGPAKPGEHFTKAQCDAMLEKRLPTYWLDIKPCIKVETSNNEKIAYTSASYNIGARAFCHSAMVSRLNAGNHKGACDALLGWTHAQGRVVRGLVNRRSEERKICLTPDPAPTPVIPAAPPKPVYAHWWSPIFSWAWWTEK